MYQLILNALHKPNVRKSSVGKHLTIPVKKYDPEVFRMIIQFIHCGYATIDDVTVTGLLCCADQFELREMKQACWKYIDTRLECGSAESILRASRSYRQHRVYEEIVDEVSD
ncbi:hypothetical protein DPMN_058685 [Dreissena polymorpha]|uniref:BTB domain-containing protein n=1 Tax=Dreissena polymorpha TaxID=45954 RepID=A0A9D4HFR2_DREPO|nr:hypothetical protein DPMN_058685 [Dreissena polymorpha]